MRTRLHPTMDREAAFAQPLLTFKDWHLSLQCPRCRVLRRIEIMRLLRLYGPAPRLGELFWRLRCEACRTPPCWAMRREGWADGRQACDIPLLP
jgi:hypothetical protein